MRPWSVPIIRNRGPPFNSKIGDLKNQQLGRSDAEKACDFSAFPY